MKRRRIKKILLINPPNFIWQDKDRKRVDFPIGLGYLGAMLKMEGFEVEGLDILMEGFYQEFEPKDGKIRFGLTDEQIKQRIDDFKPDVVGISNMFSNGFFSAIRLARMVKDIDPDIIVLLGGNHASTLPEDCLRRSQGSVDFVVIGEGDYTTGILLRAISRGADLSRIPGIAYIQEDGNSVVNPFIEPIHNVDILPYPDRLMFSIYKYSEIGRPHGDDLRFTPYTTFVSSRGCPFHCTFCAAFNVHGRTYRPRNPDLVLDELEYLVKEMGVREIHFEDDNLTYDRERAKKIFQGMIDRKLNLAWIPSNGLAFYTLDREILTLMRDSGCYTVWIPVETGDLVTLKRIKKPTQIESFKEMVPIIKELGMIAKGLFMFGFPGETREQMENTFQLAKDLDLDYATFSLLTPLPGTEIWDQALEINPELSDPNYDWERLQFGISNLMVDGMTQEELLRLRRKVWLEVNWNLREDQDPPAGM